MVSNKHVFWQALVVAFVVFWTGIIIGIMFEGSRASKLERFYLNSETNIFDIELRSELLTIENFPCEIALRENIKFADEIYSEAKQLEKYDASTKITDDIKALHKRYDLLMVMLWNNMIQFDEKCKNNTNVVVYLYQYNEPDVNTQAKQLTLSKVTSDLKQKYGDRVILIPIAYDTGVKSLELLEKRYGIDRFPVVVINEKHKFSDLVSVSDIEKYLN